MSYKEYLKEFRNRVVDKNREDITNQILTILDDTLDTENHTRPGQISSQGNNSFVTGKEEAAYRIYDEIIANILKNLGG